MNAAFGVVIVCVAFATTMEVMMATTVAMRMTPGRENFWIRVLIAFILFGFLLCWFFYVCWPRGLLLPRVQLQRFLASMLQLQAFCFSRGVDHRHQETTAAIGNTRTRPNENKTVNSAIS